MSGERRRAALAQNLFASDAPARTLVRLDGVAGGDTVYDLGAGTGRVTAALLAAGARVVAVERDANLARKVAARFAGAPVRVVEADLTRVSLRSPFKVVANLPFNVTAAALRRLLAEDPAPISATLVLQREAARRYAGLPRASALSLAAAPWFELVVSEPFRRSDFVPAPAVDVAVLHIVRRRAPWLPISERADWASFLRWAFARPPPDALRLFRPLLSGLQWRRLSADLAIAPDARRDELTPAQWLGLYRFSRSCTPERRRRGVFG